MENKLNPLNHQHQELVRMATYVAEKNNESRIETVKWKLDSWSITYDMRTLEDMVFDFMIKLKAVNE